MISVVIPYVNEDLLPITEELNKVFPGCEIIPSNGILGKGDALKNGSLSAHHPLIAWIDADMQIHPKHLVSFIKLMELYDADAVIGNKRHSWSTTRYSFIRNIISNTYNAIIRILFGISLRDTQCGIKLFKSETLKKILGNVESKKFAFDLEVICALRESKCIVIDAPVIVNQRMGIGSATPSSIIETLKETLKVWIRYRKGFYRVKEDGKCL